MSPALIGLWIAVPISAWTGSVKIGEVFKRGILCDEERNPAQICLQVKPVPLTKNTLLSLDIGTGT